MPFENAIVVEDQSVISELLELMLGRHKIPVTSAKDLAAARELLKQRSFDLMLLDLGLPDGDGLSFLEEAAAQPGGPIVIVITGKGSVESVVKCMRAGAFDYVVKPFLGSQIDFVLRKAESFRQLKSVNRLLMDGGDDSEALVGRSPAMLRMRQLIGRVAATDATVLITGESGTGKEMVAREFFRGSPRRTEAFIKVNCAAVSENLMESEFFGHERGAFTGATERREGRFELANRGTLLLDEVSEIPAPLQAKLLRVLQEREFERVGGNRTIKVNVRILATSNRDLLANVVKGEFRQDLYYRLNVFPIVVPALRERLEDVPLLAEHFLRRFTRKHGVKAIGFSDSARATLLGYHWPGNVRELQNIVERAVILSEAGRQISASTLGLPISTDTPEGAPSWTDAAPVTPVVASVVPSAPVLPIEPDTSPVLPLAELEKQAILKALAQTEGNRTLAAQVLGISIRTLRNKLQEYSQNAGHSRNGSNEHVSAGERQE